MRKPARVARREKLLDQAQLSMSIDALLNEDKFAAERRTRLFQAEITLLQVESAEAQAGALTRATWVLALATVVLAVATVVLAAVGT